MRSLERPKRIRWFQWWKEKLHPNPPSLECQNTCSSATLVAMVSATGRFLFGVETELGSIRPEPASDSTWQVVSCRVRTRKQRSTIGSFPEVDSARWTVWWRTAFWSVSRVCIPNKQQINCMDTLTRMTDGLSTTSLTAHGKWIGWHPVIVRCRNVVFH